MSARTAGSESGEAQRRRLWPLAPVVALLGALVLWGPHAAGDTPLLGAGILVGFTIAAWATGFLAEPAVTLLFFLAAIVFGIAKPATAFAGFQSPAWWLVFGGAITGIAVETTGLGRRLARLIFGPTPASYRRAVAAVALAALGLAFLLPSTTGRIFILLPIVLSFADRLGLGPGRAGRTGLVLTMAAVSFMPPTTILPANVPNSVLLGAAETLYGIKLTYGPYFLLHFPVLGALKTALIVAVIWRLFPDTLRPSLAPEEAVLVVTREERSLLVILALSLALFATDFLHGISPAWVALGAGLATLMPGIGMVSTTTFTQRINPVTLLYVAGFLGLGAVVAETGLGLWLSRALLGAAALGPGHPSANLALLALIAAGLGLITTLPALPAVLTPLAQDFAAATGLPLLSVLMLQVVVFSTVFLPYQAPPIIIAMQLGGVSLRAAAKLTLTVAAVTLAVLWPLDYLWWLMLGYAP